MRVGPHEYLSRDQFWSVRPPFDRAHTTALLLVSGGSLWSYVIEPLSGPAKVVWFVAAVTAIGTLGVEFAVRLVEWRWRMRLAARSRADELQAGPRP